MRSGEPGIGQLCHPRPCEPVFLAAPPQRAPPQVGHMVAEGHEGTAVRWHRMISKVAVDHLRQPAPLDGDRLMPAPPQRVLDPPQGRPHAVGATLPLELEGAPAGSPADVGEPQEAERLRLAEPARPQVSSTDASPPGPPRQGHARRVQPPGRSRSGATSFPRSCSAAAPSQRPCREPDRSRRRCRPTLSFGPSALRGACRVWPSAA